MSARLGNPVQVNKAATATGAGNLVTIALNNGGWVILTSIFITYVASAAAANRTPAVKVVDSTGNILWQGPNPTALTATNTLLIAMGGGLPVSNQTSPIMQFVGFPDGFSVPALSTVQVTDTGGNAQTGDTVAATIVYSN